MTEKDLLYLSDAFNWNLIALKKYIDGLRIQLLDNKVYEEFTTGKTSKLIEKLIKLHEDNCNEILSMLKENNNE